MKNYAYAQNAWPEHNVVTISYFSLSSKHVLSVFQMSQME